MQIQTKSLILCALMDSLTQVVLGAACGEAVLGKKIGNKALLFGAIGGTIPDLDVIVGNVLYKNEIDAMLFHRGFMHSIFFAIIGAFLFGWLVYKLYDTNKRKNTTTKRDWVLLFFLALFTHPILDAFTPYGTQLFAPFVNYRVAFNTIAVIDMFYTVPFLLCILLLMFFKRNTLVRKRLLQVGLGISSLYLVFTIINKWHIDSVFENSLPNNESFRYSTQPTLFTNFLWYGIAETKSNYQVAYYSIFDTSETFTGWQTISKIKYLKEETNPDVKCLSWFSNGYYNLEKTGNNQFKYSDLRYPLVATNSGYEPVFSFELFLENERLNMKYFKPKTSNMKASLLALWERLKGI